jgi:hypothetical protein
MLSRIRIAGVLSLCIVAALLVAGCAGSDSAGTASGSPSSASDSLSGTWRMDSTDGVLFVISARGDGYTVFQWLPGTDHYDRLAVLQRSGDKLSGDLAASGYSGQLTLTLRKAGAQLAMRFYGPDMNGPLHATLTKISGSTATPTPVP